MNTPQEKKIEWDEIDKEFDEEFDYSDKDTEDETCVLFVGVNALDIKSFYKERMIPRERVLEIIEDHRPQIFDGPMGEPENHAVNETLDEIVEALLTTQETNKDA